MSHLEGLAAPGATLSFFEYIGVRKAKALVARRATSVGDWRASRQRRPTVRGERQFDRDCVLANVPPAWVHHLRFG